MTLERRGAWRAKSADRRDEVEAKPGRPTCPAFLPQAAKTEWKRIVPLLAEMGLLAHIDRALLAAYCQAWSDFKASSKLLEDFGRLVTSEKDVTYQHPAVGLVNNAAERLRKLGAEFGLSPASRAGLKAPAAAETGTDKSRFFTTGAVG